MKFTNPRVSTPVMSWLRYCVRAGVESSDLTVRGQLLPAQPLRKSLQHVTQASWTSVCSSVKGGAMWGKIK